MKEKEYTIKKITKYNELIDSAKKDERHNKVIIALNALTSALFIANCGLTQDKTACVLYAICVALHGMVIGLRIPLLKDSKSKVKELEEEYNNYMNSEETEEPNEDEHHTLTIKFRKDNYQL